MVSVLQYCVCLFLLCQQRVLSQWGKKKKKRSLCRPHWRSVALRLVISESYVKENELQTGSWGCWLGVPLSLWVPRALLRHLLIKLVEISDSALLLLLLKIGLFFSYSCILCTKRLFKTYRDLQRKWLSRFPGSVFAQGTLWCFQELFRFWGVTGEKFPYFGCGSWKTYKLMRGKNPENIEKPKGSVSSFPFWPALPLLLYVLTGRAHAERKLALQMGSLLPFVRLILQSVSGCDWHEAYDCCLWGKREASCACPRTRPMQDRSRGELLLLSSEPSAAALPAERQLQLQRAVPGTLWANRGWCQGWARGDKEDRAVKVKIPRYDPTAGPVRIQLQNRGFCPGELLGILFLKTVLCIWTKSTFFLCVVCLSICVF